MDLGNFMNDNQSISNLDWLDVRPGTFDNIPTENQREIIPQLEDSWGGRKDTPLTFVPNSPCSAGPTVAPDRVMEVITTAKKAMMSGSTGKDLSYKLASLYQIDTLEAAKEELIKLASEQGLLGNVYLDLSVYDTCKEAARDLGVHKVRLAKFAVGKPRKQASFIDDNGYCLDLKKKVVEAVDYSKELLGEYENHLKIAGVISAGDTIDSKETLREALLSKNKILASSMPVEAPKEKVAIDEKGVESAISDANQKKSSEEEKAAANMQFDMAKPVLAYMQDEMLKGKVGADLKESINKRFTQDTINKFANEIKKVASLQGLLGNVYVDLSYYDSPEAAIKSIRNAKTNPIYLVYNSKKHAFDNTMEKVIQATGCVQLPRDGRIESKIAMSYIEDLKFNDRISSALAEDFLARLAKGENTLEIIKESFVKTASHSKEVRTGGVQGTELVSTRKTTDNSNLRTAAEKSLSAGISVTDVKDKLAKLVSYSEADGIIKLALKSIPVIDANIISDCKTVKYAFSSDAKIKSASKCSSCSLCVNSSCSMQKLAFVDAKDPSGMVVDVSILDKSNVRTASTKEAFFSDEGMNIELGAKKETSSFDVEGLTNRDGLDSNINS